MTLRNLEFYVKIKCFRTARYSKDLVHGCLRVRVFPPVLQEKAELWSRFFCFGKTMLKQMEIFWNKINC